MVVPKMGMRARTLAKSLSTTPTPAADLVLGLLWELGVPHFIVGAGCTQIVSLWKALGSPSFDKFIGSKKLIFASVWKGHTTLQSHRSATEGGDLDRARPPPWVLWRWFIFLARPEEIMCT